MKGRIERLAGVKKKTIFAKTFAMSEATSLFLPLKYNQLLEVVKQMSAVEKQKLLHFLLRHALEEDKTVTHFASEKSLAKDWLTPEENKAWENL
jgi:hypothetical protein